MYLDYECDGFCRRMENPYNMLCSEQIYRAIIFTVKRCTGGEGVRVAREKKSPQRASYKAIKVFWQVLGQKVKCINF